MRVSEKKKSELYKALSEPIFQLRVYINNQNKPVKEDIDNKLFRLELDIWDSIAKVLGIEKP